jgi:hypothetical protein
MGVSDFAARFSAKSLRNLAKMESGNGRIPEHKYQIVSAC